MSKQNDFDFDEMALEDEEPERKLDMDLESPTPSEIEARIKKLFPNEDIIKVDEKFELLRMAAGNYRLNNTALEDLTVADLKRLDDFLKTKE